MEPEPERRVVRAPGSRAPHQFSGRRLRQRGKNIERLEPRYAAGIVYCTVDLDKLPQQGCPACGYLAKTAVLWPKTAPAQVPLAPAKTPLRRPEKATGRVAVTTPPWAAEHAKAIRTHAGGRLRALRVAASLRSGPLACLWRRGGHSQARERASCSSRAAHQPAEKTSIDLPPPRSERGDDAPPQENGQLACLWLAADAAQM